MNTLNLSIRKSLKVTSLVVALGISSMTLAGGNNAHYDTDDKLRDAWIDGKVESALLINRHLNNFTIDTDVKGKTVYLSGTVKSGVDKELAGEIAKGIEGVVDVENNLVVKEDAKMSKKAYKDGDERSFGTWYDDSTTTAAIKSKFLWSGEVDGLDINVDTMHGVVTLNGTANTSANKALAEEMAKNTNGVTKVINKLKIKNG
ncbi:BON domain-containing protein [Marinicella litoralis]|uniref:Osmotically-inducible protein OsmY n=1 Tax=Marinicella litoralis TaxID=644220 RepID=A0A4R6XU21_9GAMM|nr:BON domain-containing protein [Marinicella litoralis]TDR23485.1 osmotically-inducible protein OsmY [Marinicella litoralis]